MHLEGVGGQAKQRPYPQQQIEPAEKVLQKAEPLRRLLWGRYSVGTVSVQPFFGRHWTEALKLLTQTKFKIRIFDKIYYFVR